MKFDFSISHKDPDEFVSHWASKYSYSNERLYSENIGKPLTEASIASLFQWKNGMVLSEAKAEGVRRNYTPTTEMNRNDICSHPGGTVWNIFFLHCKDHQNWPIFDQHTYRAMRFIQTRKIHELPSSKDKILRIYFEEYVKFLTDLCNQNARAKDKALFAFGQFLKKAKPYI